MPVYLTPISRRERKCLGPSVDTGLSNFDEVIATFGIVPVERRPAMVLADDYLLSRLPFVIEEEKQ